MLVLATREAINNKVATPTRFEAHTLKLVGGTTNVRIHYILQTTHRDLPPSNL
jgi:hypothetical protein